MSVEDWEKRGRRQYFNEDELALIRACHSSHVKVGHVARRLKCSVRSITRHYAKLEGRDKPREKKARHPGPRRTEEKPKQTESDRRASRHYHSNFEL